MYTLSPFIIILIVLSTISSVFVIFQLSLMRKLPFNGFAIIICSLAVSTLIYNISFYFHFEQSQSWGEAIALLVEMFGDLSMGVWTNIISITLFRIVFTLSNVNILKELWIYILLNISLSLGITIYCASDGGLDLTPTSSSFRIYYFIRTTQVLINLFLYAITYWKVNHLSTEVNLGKLTASQAEAVSALIGRMRYYGVVQISTRFFASCYALNTSTRAVVGLHYAAVLTSPLCGIGYFFVYVYLQPVLKSELGKLLSKWFPWLQKKNHETVSLRLSYTITMNDIELAEIIKRESEVQQRSRSMSTSADIH